jgi:integrase
VRHNAPYTFHAREDAEAWLAAERQLLATGSWSPPSVRARGQAHTPTTLEDYARSWLTRRDLKPRTRADYAKLLDNQILPALGHLPLAGITPRVVADWHHALNPKRPTLRARAYGLLRTICITAVAEDELLATPCRVRGGGSVQRAVVIKPATLPELETIVAAMPDRLQAMVLLASWCALRYGELAELRRKDLDLKNGVLHVRRGVVWADGQTIVSSPKTSSSVRDVAIPPHLIPVLRAHRDTHAAWGNEGLLFPASDGKSNLASSTMRWHFYRAREAAGRPDLRFHDLRHSGATLAASTGATLAELMARLGHSTPGAALRYQHAAKDRDREIAVALSALAERA